MFIENYKVLFVKENKNVFFSAAKIFWQILHSSLHQRGTQLKVFCWAEKSQNLNALNVYPNENNKMKYVPPQCDP